MENLSNAERASRYLRKSRLLGAPTLNLDILDDDRVVLKSVEDGEGTIVIPKFITEVCAGPEPEFFRVYVPPVLGPFGGTHYSTIIFEGSYDSFERTFKGMQSTSLKIVHSSDRLKNLQRAFTGCKNLEYLDLRGCNLSNVERTDWAFSSCEALRDLDLGSGFQRISEPTGMFLSCGLQKIRVEDWFDTSIYEKRTEWRMFPQYCIEEIDLSSITPARHWKLHKLFERILSCCKTKTLILRCVDKDICKAKIELASVSRLVIKEESPKRLINKLVKNFKFDNVEVINGLQD